jgi:tryptophan 2,3-dioxygenase
MMNTEKKMTYVDALTFAIENGNLPAEVVNKLDALRTQQVKRNTAEKKPTAKQVANLSLADKFYEAIAKAEKPVTVSELIEMVDSEENFSNQKASSIVKKPVDAGRVERIVDKRKAYFKVKEN